jgi:hypothetical protein
VTLYGPLPRQLEDRDSFTSRLARILKARAQLHLSTARLLDLPPVRARGLFVVVHQLPDSADIEVTAINFADRPVSESVPLPAAPPGSKGTDALDSQAATLEVSPDGTLPLVLQGYEGKALRIKIGDEGG